MMQVMDVAWMAFGLALGLSLMGAFVLGYRMGAGRESEDAARMRDEVADFLEMGRRTMERLRGRERRAAEGAPSAPSGNGAERRPMSRAERKEHLRRLAQRQFPEMFGLKRVAPSSEVKE